MSVAQSETIRKWFHGVEGEAIAVRRLTEGYDHPVLRIVAPSGVETWVSDQTLFHLQETGLYQLHWQHDEWGLDGIQDDDLIIEDLSLSPRLTTSSPLDVAVSFLPDGNGTSSQFVRLQVLAGERFVIRWNDLGIIPRASLRLHSKSSNSSGFTTVSLWEDETVVELDANGIAFLEAYHETEETHATHVTFEAARETVLPLSFGEVLSRTLSSIDETVVYRFEGVAGDKLLFDDLAGSDYGMTWNFFGPGGERPPSNPWGPFYSDSDVIFLIEDGTYRARLDRAIIPR